MYKIALAGNPNCGKTTLFNELTGSKQHVGNWPGVTVDKKEGKYKKNKTLEILDLPGTYSLSPYTAEEVVARDYIVKERPDVVLNIIDGTNLERNLYLTLQIMETKIPMVIALNMMDEVKKRGDVIEVKKLAKRLGVPVVAISARNGDGIKELMAQVETMVKIKTPTHGLHMQQGKMKKAMDEIVGLLNEFPEEERIWTAIKLVEQDEVVEGQCSEHLIAQVKGILERHFKEQAEDSEALVAELRYEYISTVVKDAMKRNQTGHVETKSDRLDKILTNRFLGLPIFAGVMYLLFASTFSENFLFIKGLQSPGVYLAGITETLWGMLTDSLANLLEVVGASDWVMSLVVDGIMAGVGAVAGFIPLVLVLFVLLSFLEDSGYMARVAFVMDRIFRRFGLSGKSFIPMLMGFGCSVPAVMAARTLESDKDRKITIMITPFMSCGAKLPIYAMFAGTLFGGYNKTLIIFSIYMLGIAVAIISALILNKFFFHDETSNFVMELPQYRIPTLKSIALHAGDKVKGFAVKAGTIIFGSTILIWLLSNFNFTGMVPMEESFLATIGNGIKWIFAPLGFGDWRASVGVITGWIAKENIVATFGQLFANTTDATLVDAFMSGEEALPHLNNVFNGVSGFSFMAFNLLCMPCFAAVGAIKREMGSIKWTLRTIGFQMLMAYLVALVINVVGSLIF